jgi:hypothetical protein
MKVSGVSFCLDVMRVVLIWVLALFLVGCAWPGREGGDLPGLMVERLGWMDEVAMVKLAKGLPVEDVGLPGKVVRGFFAGQIKAAKVCQEEWLARNAGREVAGEALPNLAGTVRPALDAIGKRMTGALRQARGGGNACCLVEAARDRLATEGYSQKVIAAAVGGLEAGLGREDLGCD